MSDAPRVAVVVGNPRAGSRTLAAATWLSGVLEPDAEPIVVDLATLGPALLDWSDAYVASLVEQVGGADLVVVASPTYKGAYTGLLKLFLDRFAGGTGMRGVAVPFMLSGSPAHALAPELTLRPVLAEIGARVPAQGLSVLDAQHDDPHAYAAWLDLWAESVRTLTEAARLTRTATPTATPTAPGVPA